MGHKFLTVLFVCVCLLGMNQGMLAQNSASRGILGFLDPATGAFHLLPQATDEPVPAATTFGGSFVFNFTITVSSSIGTSAKIQCLATAIVEDNLVKGLNLITEQAAVLATRSGTTATCTVTIPYSWSLITGTTDKVMLGYTISAPAEAAPTAALPSRVSSQSAFASISVPANGATTTETITPTF